MARIRALSAAPAPATIASLVKQGILVGYAPPQLAEAVGLTPDLLGRLEARAIATYIHSARALPAAGRDPEDRA